MKVNAVKLADLYMYLNADIKKIEEELEQSVLSEHPALKSASLDLLQAGGKRIRPVFVLLGAKYGNYDIDRVKHIAVSLELIHMASLVHDDVIDNAELRRGSQTIKAKWDNRVAMYTGDYIFAKAVEKTTFFNDGNINTILSHAMIQMCLGEIEQIRDQYNWEQNMRIYLRRIRRKTALLIAVSCQLGAISAGASKQEQIRLYQYGYNVGMSYQIIDDILDFTGTEKQLGKPAGGDLRQGNVTLPALYAMDRDPSLKRDIVQLIEDEASSSQDITPIIEAIKQSGGIEYSKELSRKYLNKAYSALDSLPDIKATKSLREVATYIGGRKH
ncbi:heptaprenyl diphosphate synthase [Sinobaca qinghaiensis]|uniref:Heptaprenyl diphosphate synthase component 2 n=1 Tax=Sinobaca qinghaiensis TaxID=342944 RepID=A0A419V371_9BACL|nr:heptaprenyl diphosphate synthase [Sinobaca qinghaiensis]